jgi:hypothetical protein
MASRGSKETQSATMLTRSPILQSLFTYLFPLCSTLRVSQKFLTRVPIQFIQRGFIHVFLNAQNPLIGF